MLPTRVNLVKFNLISIVREGDLIIRLGSSTTLCRRLSWECIMIFRELVAFVLKHDVATRT